MPYTVPFSVPNVGERMQRVIQRILQNASLFAEREIKVNALEIRDTGALARSFTSEVKGMEARVWSPLAYAAVMDQGRRPGARMPPPAALDGWARRHGFAPGMTFVLARAIGRRGIKGRFFVKRAVEKLQAAMPGIVAEAVRNA